MELRELVSVTVKTLNDLCPELQVKVYKGVEGVSVREIHQKSCKELGLKQSSLPYFALFYEKHGKLKKRLKTSDYLPSISCDLWLRKWCFDVKTEKILLTDGAACELLYKEAVFLLNKGYLEPSQGQKQQLDEYSDDRFKCEEKFVLLCHSIKDYFSVHVEECLFLKNEVESKGSITVDTSYLKIATGHVITYYPWFCVKQWTNNLQAKKIIFLYVDGEISERTVAIETEQAEYLSDAINQFLKEIQKEETNAPKFYSEMVSTMDEGTRSYQNPFFDLEQVLNYYKCQSENAT